MPAGPQANTRTGPTAAPRQPRAKGAVRLSVKPRDGKSVLDGLYQSGSFKALFPHGAETTAQAVLVNTAGGITGGDRFDIAARAETGTALSLTTQAAERAYCAQPGETGQLRTALSVAPGARIDWLPQETILYRGCALDRRLDVDLSGDARFLMAETLVFGRAAMGESLTRGLLRDRVDIRRDGLPLYLDAVTLEGDIARHLARPGIAGGAGALTTLVYVAPDAEAHLAPLRALLPDSAGASLLAPDVLVMRGLATDSHALRQYLIPALTRLSGRALPRPWML
ncbi:MAG: urease accessory protein UreD [Paracoccaceae bacterium]